MKKVIATLLCVAGTGLAAPVPAQTTVLDLGTTVEDKACAALAMKVVGMKRSAAAELSKKNGIPVRVVRNGKTFYPGTMDYLANRSNLELERNRVAAARCG